MTGAARSTLARLGSVLQLANQRRALLDKLDDLLDEIERGGRVVTGERALWQSAQQLLQAATSSLEAISDDRLEQVLERTEADLGREEWDLLEDIRTEVELVCTAQSTAIETLRALVSRLDVPLLDLRQAVEEGRITLAATRDAHLLYERTKALLEKVKADLARMPGEAFLRRAELEQARPVLEKMTAELRASIDHARLHLRHSELVLIRTPGQELDEYSVLLRTPAEPGAHGVHVRGTSTLVPQDRKLVFEALDKVSTTLQSGLRRDAASAAPPQPATPGSPQPTSGPQVQPPPARPAPAPPPGAPAELRGGLPPPLSGPAATRVETDLDDLGDLMFKLFLPEQMQAYLRRTPCAMTLTTNDLDMPWELMRFDDKVLCLDRCIGRMPMGNTFPRLDPPEPLDNTRIRFLLICADDGGRLRGAREEIDRIHNALMDLRNEPTADRSTSLPIEVTVLASPEVDGHRLNQHLRYKRYNVIHFAGHARFDAQQPDRSALLLDNGEVFLAQKIRRLLVGRPLVFLNACDSARTPIAGATSDAAQDLRTYLQEPAEGLAASFLYGGALGCIGSLWPVYDEPASKFAIEFYRQVLAGNVIGEAMRMARCEVKKSHSQHLTWATFVLYGNPTFRLQS